MRRNFLSIGMVLLCVFGQISFGTAQQKEWSFLIFLNGHNNLASYSDLNINQLETVGATDEMNTVVQWAKTGFDKTYRLRVEKDNDEKKVTSPILETLPRQDMGDYKNLIEFVRWSHEKFPAKRYFVSFWNHGSGWTRNKQSAVRGVSYDDYSGHHITTEQMGIAMREIAKIIGHKVDIVGADACLMAMAEVGAEMSDSVEYYIASEDLEPGLGWPYHTFYQRWAANPKASTAEISSYLVEEYYKYLSPTTQVTLSSMNLTRFPQLFESFRELNRALVALPANKFGTLHEAGTSSVGFAHADAKDLGHWLKKIKEKAESVLDPKLLSNLAEAITGAVAANKTTNAWKDAEGISFWIPDSQSKYDTYSARYANLTFAKQTGWDKVLSRTIGLPVCELTPNGQWATEVTAFSSEYGATTWSAKQVLGACNTKKYGDSATAWAPKTMDSEEEYVTIGYQTPVYATGAVIRETLGSGCVTKVEAIDVSGTTHVVWQGEDPSTTGSLANFEIQWTKTASLVKGLKVTISPKKTAGWEEIDSIQLLGTP